MHVVWILIATVRAGSGLDTGTVAVNPMNPTQVAPIYQMGPSYRQVVIGIYKDQSSCSVAAGDFSISHSREVPPNGTRCVSQQVAD
jgi:hypothetical protein